MKLYILLTKRNCPVVVNGLLSAMPACYCVVNRWPFFLYVYPHDILLAKVDIVHSINLSKQTHRKRETQIE